MVRRLRVGHVLTWFVASRLGLAGGCPFDSLLVVGILLTKVSPHPDNETDVGRPTPNPSSGS